MKVWEKIAQFSDTQGWDKERIAAECYAVRSCPSDIEEEHHFIGEKRFAKHCSLGCGVTCLEEYLELEAR